MEDFKIITFDFKTFNKYFYAYPSLSERVKFKFEFDKLQKFDLKFLNSIEIDACASFYSSMKVSPVIF